MLFDLRARGRRRTVQAVYLGLALLFGIGFIGFGVGGGFGGGGVLENVFGNKQGSAPSFSSEIAAAEKRIHRNPSDPEGWAKLADARFHEASGSEFYEEVAQRYTSQGKALLTKVADAWNRYMALNPAKPNLTVAQEMLRVYGQEGLNQPATALQVLQQVVIPAKPPSANLYGDLAMFAYQANNARVGDLASQRAIKLSPAPQRAQVKAYLERLKRNPTGNPANESFTTTTNGKSYNVKLGPHGTATGTEAAPPTPAPKKR